jgi:hypothetical protein
MRKNEQFKMMAQEIDHLNKHKEEKKKNDKMMNLAYEKEFLRKVGATTQSNKEVGGTLFDGFFGSKASPIAEKTK